MKKYHIIIEDFKDKRDTVPYVSDVGPIHAFSLEEAAQVYFEIVKNRPRKKATTITVSQVDEGRFLHNRARFELKEVVVEAKYERIS